LVKNVTHTFRKKREESGIQNRRRLFCGLRLGHERIQSLVSMQESSQNSSRYSLRESEISRSPERQRPRQEPEHEEQETPENQKLAESESEMSGKEEDESIHDSLPKSREESEQEQDPVQQDTYSLRDRSKICNPERFANISILNAEPESFEEATSSGNAEQWKQAMDEEIQSLKQNQTWTLVEPPKNQQVIDNRWVYKIKRNEDGSVQKYKARLVARGLRQIAGVDYNETFSPVSKFDSIRIILCVAASEKLILRQFDVKTAFLYGNLDEILYMQQPDGYQDGTKRAYKLNRSFICMV
jgi:hypothetical protein